jgi:hypothetical protein
VLFADVSGSTSLYEALGDAQALAIMSSVVDAMRRLGEEQGGRLIKTIGDEVMMWFPGARSAALAAVAMQRQVSGSGRDDGLGLRIGFCSGPMQHRDGDVFGDTVNTAARLASLATKGSIVTSHATWTALGGSCAMRGLGEHRLSGKAEPLPCVELLWTDEGLTTGEPTRFSERRRTLIVCFGSQSIALNAGDAAKIGRQPNCQIRLDDHRVSKVHASVSSSTGNFVLADMSSNGTTVVPDGHAPTLLRREKMILTGSGRVMLGASDELDPERTVHYELREVE